MQALLRFDELHAPGVGLARLHEASWLSMAEALPMDIARPAPAPSLFELQERLIATLALASQLPHSAWRSRLRIAPEETFATGNACWRAIAIEPAAAPFVAHASALLTPFFPHVGAATERAGGK